MNLDLDNVSTIMIEDEAPCPLCKHHNYFDLSTTFKRLCTKITKKELFDCLHNIYCEKAAVLTRQEIDYEPATKLQIQNHFMYHELYKDSALIDDIRVLQKLQEQVLHAPHSVDPNTIQLFKSLSAYKLSLFNSLGEALPHKIVKPSWLSI